MGKEGADIIATSSTAGIKGLPFLAPYVAAKHGVVGDEAQYVTGLEFTVDAGNTIR